MITYFENHKIGIDNYQKTYYIGSQTEAMISHLLKSIKGYGAKVYNLKTFVNLLNLRLGYINKLKQLIFIVIKYLKVLKLKKVTLLKNYELNKGKENDWTETIEQYDIPIMKTKN